MKMTRIEFFDWVRKRTQFTENEMLSPYNRDIADSEMVEVLSWRDFTSLIYQIDTGKIELIKEEVNE